MNNQNPYHNNIDYSKNKLMLELGELKISAQNLINQFWELKNQQKENNSDKKTWGYITCRLNKKDDTNFYIEWMKKHPYRTSNGKSKIRFQHIKKNSKGFTYNKNSFSKCLDWEKIMVYQFEAEFGKIREKYSLIKGAIKELEKAKSIEIKNQIEQE